MAFTSEQIKELDAPLDRAKVKEREQAGRKFSYVEAYHCENEANRIFGFSAWDRFTTYECITEREQDGKHRVYYRAKVRIVVRSEGGEITTREGCGYGSGIDRDIGQAHESALKEAESDAEKRALKTFGNPFGQALYDKEQTDVVTTPKAPSLAVTAAQTAITSCNTRAELTAWKAANDAMLSSMKAGPDYAAIENAYKARWRVLDPAADTFRGGPANGVANGTDHREGAVQ